MLPQWPSRSNGRAHPVTLRNRCQASQSPLIEPVPREKPRRKRCAFAVTLYRRLAGPQLYVPVLLIRRARPLEFDASRIPIVNDRNSAALQHSSNCAVHFKD
jgi:hypothetical protein